MRPTSVVLLLVLFISASAFAQQPRYTPKSFVRQLDSNEFRVSYPKGDGPIRTYIVSQPLVWDIDDDSTTYVRFSGEALLCIEGRQKNGRREGAFSVYLVDSADHRKRYRIWEQHYAHDKLNGLWNTYTLRGTLVSFQTFKEDSLHGVSRNFWIDGRSIMDETEYFSGENKLVKREYFSNGKLKSEIPIRDQKINGKASKYYESGTIQEMVEFRDGEFDGVRRYYHPNGQLWIEQIYRKGKSWTVVANFSANGQKRDPGTLRDGNGTVIFYNDDGTVREVVHYANGVAQK